MTTAEEAPLPLKKPNKKRKKDQISASNMVDELDEEGDSQNAAKRRKLNMTFDRP